LYLFSEILSLIYENVNSSHGSEQAPVGNSLIRMR